MELLIITITTRGQLEVLWQLSELLFPTHELQEKFYVKLKIQNEWILTFYWRKVTSLPFGFLHVMPSSIG
jgi:hypothetical protein